MSATRKLHKCSSKSSLTLFIAEKTHSTVKHLTVQERSHQDNELILIFVDFLQITMVQEDKADNEALYNNMTVSQIKDYATEPNITGTPEVSSSPVPLYISEVLHCFS